MNIKSMISGNVVLISLLLIGLLNTQTAQSQLRWGFDNKSPLSDGTGKVQLHLSGRLASPELVDGLLGKGLRTDGYSTCLSAAISPEYSFSKQISGYFALETYPTDTAGFFTIYQKTAGRWISACIDKYGTPMLAVSDNDKVSYFPSKSTLQKFSWLNIRVNFTAKNIQLVVNSHIVATTALPAGFGNTKLDSLEIGKSGTHKSIGIFPVNFINGIIDEVSISRNVFVANKASSDNLKIDLKKTPKLNVPSSRFAGDFTRPKYHLLPAANWTNETHGLIFYDGLYHIFNQKNGANLFLGQINWGHFTSPDLVHWTEHKPILTPQLGYDQNGIWSGCCVRDDNGVPTIFYSSSSARSFDICKAIPTDKSLLTWIKPKDNPVIGSSPEGYSRKDFHDPYVWREGLNWYMIVGFGLNDNNNNQRGTVLLYRSSDLDHWTYLHPLFEGDPKVDDSGVFWEMPVFYKLDGKYILLVNKVPNKGVPARALYWTGNFVNEKFVPDSIMPKNLEVINRLLSPSVAKDANGRTTAIAIIPDETSARATYNVGWTHLYSIPRVWTLRNGKICQEPHPAIYQLRNDAKFFDHKEIANGDSLLLWKGGQQLEISVDIVPDSIGKFGFIVGKNPDNSEYSKIYYDFEKKELIVDQTRSSTRKYIPLKTRSGKYELGKNKKVNFHLFFDGSVIEGFINNEDAFTTRLFPASPGSNEVMLYAEGGKLNLLGATVWKLSQSQIKTDF